MTAKSRFLFGEDFRADPAPAADAPDPCAEAAAAAYEAGMAAGRAEAAAETERRLAEALAFVGTGLAAGLGRIEAAEAAIEGEAFGFFEALARALAGQALAETPLAPFREAAETAFRHLRGVPHLAVRVPPELVEGADATLGRMARERGYEGRIIVLGEDGLGPGDVRFEWADGGAVADRQATDAAIAAALAAGREASAAGRIGSREEGTGP